MKKNLILLIAICSISTASFSQGFYTEVNTGYGFSFGSDIIDYNITSSSVDAPSGWTSSDKYETVKGSFGQGAHFGLDFGYMINPNIGISLSASYLLGRKYSSTYSYSDTYTDGMMNSFSYQEEIETNQQGQMLRVTPSIVIALDNEKVKPFAKLGLALGVMNELSLNSDYSNTNGDSQEVEGRFYSGLALGLSSEIGFELVLSEKFSFVSSLNSVNMSYAPTKGELISFKVNGQEQVGTLTTRDKEVEFVDSYTYNSSSIPDENQPSQEIKEYHPFSSVGLRVGFRMNF